MRIKYWIGCLLFTSNNNKKNYTNCVLFWPKTQTKYYGAQNSCCLAANWTLTKPNATNSIRSDPPTNYRNTVCLSNVLIAPHNKRTPWIWIERENGQTMERWNGINKKKLKPAMTCVISWSKETIHHEAHMNETISSLVECTSHFFVLQWERLALVRRNKANETHRMRNIYDVSLSFSSHSRYYVVLNNREHAAAFVLCTLFAGLLLLRPMNARWQSHSTI